MRAQLLGQVQLFATPQTVVHQALLSMGFSRQEYWSGLPFPSPGDLPDSGIKPVSPASHALAGGFFTTEPLGSPFVTIFVVKYRHLSQTGNSRSLARVEEDATEAAVQVKNLWNVTVPHVSCFVGNHGTFSILFVL